MAKPDFDKVFASNGSVLPLTDTQFLQGLAYLGDNPPTKEEFNWLFQQFCLKMQWLNQNSNYNLWQSLYAYSVGDVIHTRIHGSYKYAECTVAGTSGTTEPTWPVVGETIADGTASWIMRDMRVALKLINALTINGTLYDATEAKNITISGVPAGGVADFAMSTPPSGWLKANGAAVSRTAYADLFAAIGTTFGSGDGSTTFNLPDNRGAFRRGWDDGRGLDGGRVFGSYQDDDLKSHTHTMALAQGYYNNADLNVPTGSYNNRLVATTPSTNATGGTETRPKNIALLACIKY